MNCPDDCSNCDPPYCHCMECAATGIELNELGLCVPLKECWDCGEKFICSDMRYFPETNRYACWNCLHCTINWG